MIIWDKMYGTGMDMDMDMNIPTFRLSFSSNSRPLWGFVHETITSIFPPKKGIT